MTLRDTQMWMVSAITGAEVDAKNASKVVTASDRMTANERLDIYRNGYKLRLVDCLRDDYPVLAGALGEDAFDELARAYIDRHPSNSPNLNYFGRHMQAFARDYFASAASERVGELEGARLRVPSNEKEHSTLFASELAALEWAMVEVLHAEMAPPLDAAKLQALPLEQWATARFAKSDALRVFRFEYPINAFFQSRWVDEDDVAIPGPSKTALAVYRKDTQIWRMDLTPAMASILVPLYEGATFGEALEKLEEEITDPEALGVAAQNLMVWFREWALGGFFSRVDLA